MNRPRRGFRRGAALLLAALAGLTAWRPAAAQEYQVDVSRPRRVVFHSKTPVNEFEGVTDRIDGYAAWGSAALAPGRAFRGSRLYFEVDLNALDTGNGLRNRHMRERYLETRRYPFATLTGVIDSVARGRGDTLLVAASGTFAVHGVERPLAITCQVTPGEGGGAGYAVHCGFPVRLPDHQIRIPSLMVMELNEQVDLSLDFAVHRATP